LIIKLPSCLIKKKQDKFCHRINVWKICFVDIAVGLCCDLFVLLCSKFYFFFLYSNFICLRLLMVNKVDHNVLKRDSMQTCYRRQTPIQAGFYKLLTTTTEQHVMSITTSPPLTGILFWYMMIPAKRHVKSKQTTTSR